MEATIQSSNIQINVSINIDAMKANIQRCLQQIVNRVDGVVANFSIKRLYRRQLRMMYAIGRATERHPAIADTVLWLTGIGLVIEIIFFV